MNVSRKILQSEQETTKRKINAFLDAASTGKLWSNDSTTPIETPTTRPSSQQQNKSRRVAIGVPRTRSAATTGHRTQSEVKLDDFFQVSSTNHDERA